jgi:hypothetical protein
MHRYCFPVFLTLAVSALAGCQRPDCELVSPESGLEGTWQLTSRQCFCPPGPVPKETLTLTATDFAFHRDGQLTASGTYARTTGATICGLAAAGPALSFTYTTGSRTPANALVTLSGQQLKLDFGGPCDAPVETYTRLP